MSANRIQLVGTGRQEEDRAGGTITPGHMIELYDDAGARKVRVHQTEGGYHEKLFALEDALQGNEIDDDYAAGDLVTYVIGKPGDVVNAILKAGETVVHGDKLISAGDGTLIANGSQATATTVAQLVGVAEENLDLSASGAVNTRLAVRLY